MDPTNGVVVGPKILPADFHNLHVSQAPSYLSSRRVIPRPQGSSAFYGAGPTTTVAPTTPKPPEEEVPTQTPEAEAEVEAEVEAAEAENRDKTLQGYTDPNASKYPRVYLDNIYNYTIGILVCLGIYSLAYIGQLASLRLLAELIFYGFYRQEMAPGPWISDRIMYFGIVMAMAASRLPVIYTGVRMLSPITSSIGRALNLIALIAYLFIDVLLIISLAVAWGFLCNTSGYGMYAPCNAPPADMCAKYGASMTTRCYDPSSPSPSLELSPTWSFYWLFGSLLATFILEVILLVLNVFLDDEAREYKNHLVFYKQ